MQPSKYTFKYYLKHMVSVLSRIENRLDRVYTPRHQFVYSKTISVKRSSIGVELPSFKLGNRSRVIEINNNSDTAIEITLPPQASDKSNNSVTIPAKTSIKIGQAEYYLVPGICGLRTLETARNGGLIILVITYG